MSARKDNVTKFLQARRSTPFERKRQPAAAEFCESDV